MKQKGFSLIELSIVISIMALLIAGIVGGSKLISSAKLSKLMKDLRQIETEIGQFVMTYDAYPGDYDDAYAVFGTACYNNTNDCNGDGNGQIRWDTPSYDTFNVGEAIQVWKHLKLANISSFSPNYDGPSDNPAGFPVGKTHGIKGLSMPDSKIKGGYFVFYSDGSWTNGAGRTVDNNVVTYAEEDIGQPDTYNMKITDVYNLDKKHDDGDPLDGKIWTENPSCRKDYAVTEGYELSDTSILCNIIYVLTEF